MGKANNLRARVASYRNRADIGPRTAVLLSKIKDVDYILVASELEALLLEANLIKKYEPPFNVRWMDGKAYPFIKITVKEQYPSVLQVRRIDDPKSLYYGPFPNIGDVRRILKWVRRIFPYQSVRNHAKKTCLYYHLGLCPCLPAFDDKKSRRRYRRNIGYLIDLLAGKKEHVVRKLAKEMSEASKKEDFEEAGRIKRQLNTLTLITSAVRSPSSYIENPNLLSDEARLDLDALRAILATYFRGLTLQGEPSGRATNSLSRIECYDISNIQGKEATGSMVVATDGQIDKSQYRRFKIRLKDTPDDVSMHKEMLARRLKHTEWPLPDLIVIDGGKPQVHAAIETLHNQYTGILVIGLAKRLEEIIIPTSNKNLASKRESFRGYFSIRLPGSHRALKLLQRLRDEAHRFAITYHRKLRRKNLFS